MTVTAFAHYAPTPALEIFRARFEPSTQLQKPHAMAGVNVIAAETDAQARHLLTSLQMRFTDMVRGARVYMKPPIDDIETYWSPPEKAQVERMLACTFAGSPATLRGELQDFIARTGVDELMVATAVYDHGARLRSYELLAGV